MKIEIRKSAIKDLKNISEPFKTKIHNKILELKKFPNLQNIKNLQILNQLIDLELVIIEFFLMLKKIL